MIFNEELLKQFKLQKVILTEWLNELNAKIAYLQAKEEIKSPKMPKPPPPPIDALHNNNFLLLLSYCIWGIHISYYPSGNLGRAIFMFFISNKLMA